MKKITLSITFLFISILAFGQLTIAPASFDVDEQITITIDTNSTDTDCNGFNNPTEVYMHSGAGDDTNAFAFDVVGNWGQDDGVGEMTDIGGGLFSITITPSTYYNLTSAEINSVTQLGMVFRNGNGSQEFKDNGCSDFIIPVGSFQLFLDTSLEGTNIVDQGNALAISATTSLSANFELFANGTSIDTQTNTSSYSYNYTVNSDVIFELVATEPNSNSTQAVNFSVITTPVVNNAALPANVEDGINYDPNTPDEITLVLYAPNKNFVHVIGNFGGTDWNLSNTYLMNRDPSNDRFWITITGLNNHPDNNFLFQYMIDAQFSVADPYSELVLDNFNDPYIQNSIFPDLPDYPEDKTSQMISYVRLNQAEYQWQVPNFQRPNQDELVVYELLIRDFDVQSSFDAVLNRLDYLEGLGVNAIQFMPVNEFDGNISWGYAPALHGALDKYYGTPEDFKALVDECHMRGMAVIIDVVYNHGTGQNPYYRMWNDCNGCTGGQALPENPFFNVNDPNPVFSFFNDMDHESTDMEEYMDRMNRYWIEEYKVDGYRYDFTKGFTNTPGDGGGFDSARIQNITRMYNALRSFDSSAYVILEHFTGNDEESQLINHRLDANNPNEKGMQVWSNFNFTFNQATMGYGNSDWSFMKYQNRGWSTPSNMSYMESHDEERLMFKNLEFGNFNSSYDVRDLNTALSRMKTAGAFFFPVPGPKLIWQFGELGYDFSIDQCPDGSIDSDCRTAPKPIPWTLNYDNNPNRMEIYDTWSKLIQLKLQDPIFDTDNFTLEVSNPIQKKIFLVNDNAGPDDLQYVTIIGNFGLNTITSQPFFQEAGTWYDLMTEAPLQVTDTNMPISLAPGEFKIFGNELVTLSNDNFQNSQDNLNIYPNPTHDYFSMNTSVEHIDIYSLSGQLVKSFDGDYRVNHRFDIQDLNNGLYVVKIGTKDKYLTTKLIKN